MSFRRPTLYTRRKSKSPLKPNQPVLQPLYPEPTSSQVILCRPGMFKSTRRPDRAKTGPSYIHAPPPLLALPGKRTYTQPNLNPRSQSRSNRRAAGDQLTSEGDFLTDSVYITGGGDSLETRQMKRAHKRQRQWARWSEEVIPSLIGPHLRYLRKSDSLRHHLPADDITCTQDCQGRDLEITCVLFDGMYHLLTRWITLIVYQG
jgi:hypothetical protein